MPLENFLHVSLCDIYSTSRAPYMENHISFCYTRKIFHFKNPLDHPINRIIYCHKIIAGKVTKNFISWQCYQKVFYDVVIKKKIYFFHRNLFHITLWLAWHGDVSVIFHNFFHLKHVVDFEHLRAFERVDVMGIFLWIIKEIKEILIDELQSDEH